jgi:hypothetical protein
VDAVSHTNLHVSLNRLFDIVNGVIHVELLAEHDYMVGLRLPHSLQKNYCANLRHLHVTGSVPHTMPTKNFIWFNFLYRYESDDTMLFYARSDKV